MNYKILIGSEGFLNMVNYKLLKKTSFIFFISIFFNFFSVYSEIAGQINLKPSKSMADIDFRIPLEQCFHIENDKILPIKTASDNASNIFIGLPGGKIGKLNLKKILTIWNTELGGEIISDLVYGDNKIFIVTKLLDDKDKNTASVSVNSGVKHYILWAIDAETGITAWHYSFTANRLAVLHEFQRKLFLIIDNENITSINKIDGKMIFEKNIRQKFGSILAFSSNKIYIATDNHSIIVVSADNGELNSQILTPHSIVTNIIAYGDNLYWGEKEGYVNAADLLKKNRLWSTRQGGEIFSMTITSKGILVTSLDNFVYMISLQKGRRIWKKRLTERILYKPLLLGNFVMFVTTAANSAVVLDTSDGKIVNNINLGNGVHILSAPLIAQNLILFSTNKGIFAFSDNGLKCSEKEKE